MGYLGTCVKKTVKFTVIIVQKTAKYYLKIVKYYQKTAKPYQKTVKYEQKSQIFLKDS